MKELFLNEIVETIIFMLLNGLITNNASLSWGTELHLRTKQGIHMVKTNFSIAISSYDASCYNDMLLLGCAYTSKILKVQSNRFLTCIYTIHYGDKMFDCFWIVHAFGCLARINLQ